MPDFKELLNKKVDEQKRPPILPAGTYEGVVRDYVLGEARNEDKTPLITFNVQITGPTDDIDQEDLVDEDGNPVDPNGRRFRQDFFLTDAALYRLTEFIQSCGVDTSGKGFNEVLPDTKGAQVLVTLMQGTTKAGDPFNGVQKLVGTANE